MPSLADQVLPLIRTRADLHRYAAANAHGASMHDGVDLLEQAVGAGDPVEVQAVTHRALASAMAVIARADDSSGIIGDACRRLLELHPRTAAAAGTPQGRLVDWMMTFQFEGEVDFFELDPVAYAPALGADGVAAYRRRLADIRAQVGETPADPLAGDHRHERWVLDWNDRRLAVLDRDPAAVIATHAGDRRIARWFGDTATALAEIGRPDLAVDWARRGTEVEPAHQAQECADLWCALLTAQPGCGPGDVAAARREVFDRWPNPATAARLHEATAAAGHPWADIDGHVVGTLAARPWEAVSFVLHTLGDPARAWRLAHELGHRDQQPWSALAEAYEAIDPAATIPVHTGLVEADLTRADAGHYRAAAQRLAWMRTLATAIGDAQVAAEVDRLVTDLRLTHRRPRLQAEFDRAGLP